MCLYCYTLIFPSNWFLWYLYIVELVLVLKYCSLYVKVVPYTSGKIWSARLIFLFFWQCVWLYISTVINIKILTNSNQQTQSYKFTSHMAAFLWVCWLEYVKILIFIRVDILPKKIRKLNEQIKFYLKCMVPP